MKDLNDLKLPSEFLKMMEKMSEEIQIECVYLLGVIHKSENLNTIYISNSCNREEITQYHILVVKKCGEKNNEDVIQSKIEVFAKDYVPTIAWSIPAKNFIEQIHSNESFATCIFQKARLCFGVSLVDKITVHHQQLISDSSKWFKRAKEFLVGANLFILRREFALAAFLLHQSAEQSYLGYIFAITGYIASIHNLNRLHLYATAISFDAIMIFPRNNEKEQRLFEILKSSYVAPRYTNDFYVSERDLNILFERVKKLSSKFEDCIRENII